MKEGVNLFIISARAVQAAVDFEEARIKVSAMVGDKRAQEVLQEAERRHRETRTTKSLGELVWEVGREHASDNSPR